MTTRTINKKKRIGKCLTPYCRSFSRGKNNYCYSCKQRKYKERHPFRYEYNVLKQNAKRRGHFFGLTFQEFKKFCLETSYLEKKGRTKRKFSIDRINVRSGYVLENIQLITVSANSKKMYLDYEDLPF